MMNDQSCNYSFRSRIILVKRIRPTQLLGVPPSQKCLEDLNTYCTHKKATGPPENHLANAFLQSRAMHVTVGLFFRRESPEPEPLQDSTERKGLTDGSTKSRRFQMVPDLQPDNCHVTQLQDLDWVGILMQFDRCTHAWNRSVFLISNPNYTE